MGVYLPNMKMPKTCWECEFALYSYSKLPSEEINKTHKFQCVLTDKAITSTKRNRFCPLIEIDENAFNEVIKGYLEGLKAIQYGERSKECL